MFRAGEALYNLRRFEECCEVLAMLCQLYPLNDLARASLDRAQSRLKEQKTGEFNFKLLQAEAKQLRPPHLDHATYIGPVEVRQTASKGRGLFVTKEVKAGGLLLCEKAFAHSHAAEKPDSPKSGESKISILLNPETNTGFMGTQADLIKNIAQKMYCNPSVAPEFLSLHHGNYHGLDTAVIDQMPIVDTLVPPKNLSAPLTSFDFSFQVERTISLNSFGSPLSSIDSHTKIRDHKGEKESAFHSSGIWIQASYINHGCNSNARRSFIGDMMIVRATRDIKKDTELSFWYTPPDGSNSKDKRSQFKNWGFECTCVICSDNKSAAPTVLQKRELLGKKLKQGFRASPVGSGTLQKFERMLDELNQTYSQPPDKVPRLFAWDLQLALAQAYASQDQARKCIMAAGKVLTSLGFIISGTDTPQTAFSINRWGVLNDYLVETFVLLRNMFLVAKSGENAKKAGEYARTAYKMAVGEDTTFDKIWGAGGV